MSGSYRGGPSGARAQGGASRAGWGLRAAMDQLWDSFEQRTARPAASTGGDVRAAVLSVLLDGPMHGSQIIHAITDRSAGAWRPTAGAVYPTLLLLTDEGLLAAEDTAGGRSTRSPSRGRGEAQAARPGPTPGARRVRPTAAGPARSRGPAHSWRRRRRRSPAPARPSRSRMRSPRSTRRVARSTRSSPGPDRDSRGTDPARRPRRVRPARAAPAIAASCASRRRYMVENWWFELVPAPHRPRARSAPAAGRAAWHRTARSFYGLAIELGGLMIKVGQFISTRLDVLPPEMTKELEGLQDEVPAVPSPRSARSPSPSSGVPLERAYAAFDETPLAAASLGQVHRARLTPDSTPPTPASPTWSSRSSGRASTRSSTSTSPRSAASPAG